MMKSLLHKIENQSLILLLLFSILSLAMYYCTNGAGMVFDFNGWALLYEKGSFKDVWTCFGYPGLHQMEHLFFYSFYKIFRFNTTAWYILFASLHALCAYIGFQLIKEWLRACHFKNPLTIAFLTSLFFLTSPFAVDTITNKVTIHYLLSITAMYTALFTLISYYKKRKTLQLLLILLLFIFALFSLELSYIFPPMFILVWTSLHWFNKKKDFSLQNIMLTLSPALILILFLILHKTIIGSTIGHYGAEVHLSFTFAEVFSNTVRYFASYMFFFDFWGYKYKDFASQLLSKYAIILSSITILAGIVIAYWSIKKELKKVQFLFFIFGLGLLALGPIITLYYAYLFPIQNDRYGYFSSLFIYAFIVGLFYLIKWQRVRQILITIFLLCCTYFLISNLSSIAKSQQITWALLNDYRWHDEEVIILNVPENFNGALQFGSLSDTSSFSKSLYLHTGIDNRADINVIYEMNYCKLSDGVDVKTISPHHYDIQMHQWGCWWWKNLNGALSYENEQVKVILIDATHYELYVKEPAQHKKIIYADGLQWYELTTQ